MTAQKRWVVVVLGELGWSRFDAGFCTSEGVAQQQLAIYATQYPGKSFMVISQ